MKNIYSLLFGVVALIACSISHAQVDNQIDNMFQSLGQMGNYTPPMARAGTISGGSLSIRNGIMAAPQLINFSPPSFGGGCGGIDLVGGSFSFISKEQLTAYMRRIASNAETYAFELGLSALCPQCQKEMARLQKLTTDINSGMLNSCQAAQMAIGGKNSPDAGTYYSQWSSAIQSDSSDFLNGLNPGPGNPTPAQNLSNSNPTAANQIIPGNVVWKALTQSNTVMNIPGGNQSLQEDIMSVTGTVIQCTPGGNILGGGCPPSVPSDPNKPGAMVSFLVRPTMSLIDAVNGTHDGSLVTRLVCDDMTNCMNPTPTAAPNFKGFAQLVREAFLGSDDPNAASSQGIIYDALHTPTTIPDKDRAYLNNLKYLGSMVLNLAYQNGEPSARMFADEYANTTAVLFMEPMMRDYIIQTEQAVANSQLDHDGKTGEMLHQTMQRLETDYQKLMASQVRSTDMVTEYLHLVQVEGADPPPIPVSPPKR